MLAAAAVGAYAGLRGAELSGPLARLDILFEIPLAAAGLSIAVVALLPVFLRDWRVGFWTFACWLPVEDLVRKFAGNDIRVYIAKDILFLLLLASVGTHLRRTQSWAKSLGDVRVATLLLLGWAAALAAYAMLDDWRVGLLGLRLNFLYLPLVAVGYFIALDRDRLKRTLLWLTVIATGTVSLGIVQYVVGPSFLRPSTDTPGLVNLELLRGYRTAAGSVSQVFRPSGTFADPGRFASMALVALVLSLACIAAHHGAQVADRQRRLVGWAGLLISIVGVYVSGGRAPLVVGLAIAVIAVVGPRTAGRSRLVRVTAMVAVAMVGAVVLVAVAPTEASKQASFYTQSLDPRSEKSEWDWRWGNYTESIAIGYRNSSTFGRGAGTHSVGLQYLYGGAQYNVKQVEYEVESGWGAVAIEYGKVGLVLWAVWSVLWMRRMSAGYRRLRGRPEARIVLPMALWVFMLLFVLFMTGYQSFQNYISNAHLWLLSGIVFGLAWGRQPPDQVHESTTRTGERTTVLQDA